jgi:septum formation protein
VVLAADTVVVLDGKIYGKPSGEVEAREMLQELAGRTHRVLTGYAVLEGGSRPRQGLEESLVTMKSMEIGGLEEYMSLGEYKDKAGSYAVQGKGSLLIEKIEGSYTNVVGLPLETVMEILENRGYRPVRPSLDRFLTGEESFRPTSL